MKRTGVVLTCLMLLPLLNFAQDKAAQITADVDYGFYVGGQYVSAGTYEFKPTVDGTKTTMSVLNRQTNETIVVPIITTISKRLPAIGEVVFDHEGYDYYLAEIFIPGTDGFLIRAAPGKHSHYIVKANK